MAVVLCVGVCNMGSYGVCVGGVVCDVDVVCT